MSTSTLDITDIKTLRHILAIATKTATDNIQNTGSENGETMSMMDMNEGIVKDERVQTDM